MVNRCVSKSALRLLLNQIDFVYIRQNGWGLADFRKSGFFNNKVNNKPIKQQIAGNSQWNGQGSLTESFWLELMLISLKYRSYSVGIGDLK